MINLPHTTMLGYRGTVRIAGSGAKIFTQLPGCLTDIIRRFGASLLHMVGYDRASADAHLVH